MAFSYDNSLGDAISRIRLAVGDVVDPGLLPDETYTALLSLSSDNETLTTRKIAMALATQYAQKPTDVRLVSGTSVSWGERVKTWWAIARGELDSTSTSVATITPQSGQACVRMEYKLR